MKRNISVKRFAMSEKRRIGRKVLRPPVQVFDAMSGERLGQIGNISSQGLMIIRVRQIYSQVGSIVDYQDAVCILPCVAFDLLIRHPRRHAT